MGQDLDEVGTPQRHAVRADLTHADAVSPALAGEYGATNRAVGVFLQFDHRHALAQVEQAPDVEAAHDRRALRPGHLQLGDATRDAPAQHFEFPQATDRQAATDRRLELAPGLAHFPGVDPGGPVVGRPLDRWNQFEEVDPPGGVPAEAHLVAGPDLQRRRRCRPPAGELEQPGCCGKGQPDLALALQDANAGLTDAGDDALPQLEGVVGRPEQHHRRQQPGDRRRFPGAEATVGVGMDRVAPGQVGQRTPLLVRSRRNGGVPQQRRNVRIVEQPVGAFLPAGVLEPGPDRLAQGGGRQRRAGRRRSSGEGDQSPGHRPLPRGGRCLPGRLDRRIRTQHIGRGQQRPVPGHVATGLVDHRPHRRPGDRAAKGRQRLGLGAARHAAEVGLAVVIGEHLTGVLGVPATGRRVERDDRLALPGHHLAPGLGDRAIGHRVLDIPAVVDLTAGRGADVESLADELVAVAPDVCARSHRLGLQRLHLRVHLGPQLRGHDAEQVTLQTDPVDRLHRAHLGDAQLDDAAVTRLADGDPAACRRHDDDPLRCDRDALVRDVDQSQTDAVQCLLRFLGDPEVGDPLGAQPFGQRTQSQAIVGFAETDAPAIPIGVVAQHATRLQLFPESSEFLCRGVAVGVRTDLNPVDRRYAVGRAALGDDRQSAVEGVAPDVLPRRRIEDPHPLRSRDLDRVVRLEADAHEGGPFTGLARQPAQRGIDRIVRPGGQGAHRSAGDAENETEDDPEGHHDAGGGPSISRISRRASASSA